MKLAFFIAIIARLIRQYQKNKYPERERVQIHLPEIVKFLLTWVFIHVFTITVLWITSTFSENILKIFG
jgi:uncharacterized paraquat-inducible protein A